MNLEPVFSQSIYVWIVLPIFIFLARLVDVTLQTIRIVFVSRGLRFLSPLVGFFEILIWLFAIKAVMQNLNNAACFFAYAAGFSAGNFLGLIIEKKIAIGRAVLRIITTKDATELISFLRSQGYGVTSLDAQGVKGEVHVIYMIIRRSDFGCITEIIHKYNPKAFYTLEDIRFVSEGIFPAKKHNEFSHAVFNPLRMWRKGK